jgi:hypothetical protein
MDAQNRPSAPRSQPLYTGRKSAFGPSWWELGGNESGPAAPPPTQESPPTASQVGRREIAEVEAILANIDRDWEKWPEDRENPFYQGIRHTFEWALGRVPAPFTQVLGPPDLAALRTEDDASHDEIYCPTRRPLRKDYWVGVQHSTMWLLGETEECSWSMIHFDD